MLKLPSDGKSAAYKAPISCLLPPKYAAVEPVMLGRPADMMLM